jgi:hypothetical protein
LNSTFDDRKRRNFLPNFLIELRILIRRQLNHRISQHHDSLPPQLIIKFFVVPGILQRKLLWTSLQGFGDENFGRNNKIVKCSSCSSEGRKATFVIITYELLPCTNKPLSVLKSFFFLVYWLQNRSWFCCNIKVEAHLAFWNVNFWLFFKV